ncbi:MAG: NFACT RNA binding domain-containing protein [Polyangiaceae bacterium]
MGSGERTILVGRGGADNDALTTRHARPHDLWLHAKSRKGAHVVVPLDKGESCPPELLADAATRAAHFSDSRGEAASEVQYAERRHIRKRRKSAPGEVVVDREKVIVLRLEPTRLARLLVARGDASG